MLQSAVRFQGVIHLSAMVAVSSATSSIVTVFLHINSACPSKLLVMVKRFMRME
jgi:hypothetical protein